MIVLSVYALKTTLMAIDSLSYHGESGHTCTLVAERKKERKRGADEDRIRTVALSAAVRGTRRGEDSVEEFSWTCKFVIHLQIL